MGKAFRTNAVTHGHLRDPVTHLDDDATQLMSRGDGAFRLLNSPKIPVQVTSTNPGCSNIDEHVIGL